MSGEFLTGTGGENFFPLGRQAQSSELGGFANLVERLALRETGQRDKDKTKSESFDSLVPSLSTL